MPDTASCASVEVKICGLMRREDVQAADQLGADYLGVVLSSGFRRSVHAADAPALVANTRATKVVVLVDETAARASMLASRLGAGVIQLHGSEPSSTLAELRSAGEWRLWKSVRARSAADVEEAAERYRGLAHALLVEGWKEGVVGGGGAALAAEPLEVRAAIGHELDFVLAGGLTPLTVGDAVERFLPDIVDVSSGVEGVPLRKDPELLRAFIHGARAASRSKDTAWEAGGRRRRAGP